MKDAQPLSASLQDSSVGGMLCNCLLDAMRGHSATQVVGSDSFKELCRSHKLNRPCHLALVVSRVLHAFMRF